MNIKSPMGGDICGLRALWQETFGDTDEFLDIFFTHGFSADRCRFVEAEGAVAAALYWFDCEYAGGKIAYIYAVATAKTHRGKGLCHKLMDHTHKHLQECGYKGAILVPGSSSLFEFYKSMGYSSSCYVHEFSNSAATAKTTIAKITKEEYCALRRTFITENAVIQENENMDFLASYADFYQGNGFIFAAYKANDTLICCEILGDISSASQIVSTLQCKKGKFRTQGDSKPFAMYLPLDKNSAPPSYFCFAFD